MEKGADAYRSIGEAARLVGVAPHVLRYWESQFPQLKPVRRPDGRRYYRPDDVRLAAGLAEALREEGLTTRGAARLIARDGGAELRARGAARLPEVFALDGAGAMAVTPRAEAPATTPKKPRSTTPRPRKAPAAPEAAAALPLFADRPAATDSLPVPVAAPVLARLSHLAAHLHGAGPTPAAPAALQRAVADLRAHLARRD